MKSLKGKEGKPQIVLVQTERIKLESPTKAFLKYRTRAGGYSPWGMCGPQVRW